MMTVNDPSVTLSGAALQVLLSEEGIAANMEGESFQEILSDLLVDKSRLD